MLQQFVDRKRELAFLGEIYGKEGFSLVAIYGRRRVGKTALIKEFMRGKKGAYILLSDESMDENIRYMKDGFAEMLGRPYFRNLEVKGIYDLFSYLSDELGKERFIIALDEFPYLLEINRGILSTFQKIADEVLAESNVMLIISGSSLSMMESDVLGYRSPLYGRNLRAWKLLPFRFPAVYSVYKDLRKSLDAYFVFGGIPYYLKFYDESLSLEENIERNVLRKGSPLYDEPMILLRQEFRESRTYRLILKYISLGYRSIGKLCSATGMDKGNISKYLDTLKETGMVTHILPMDRKRGGIYEINDPFMEFWFRFVYPGRADIELEITGGVIEEIRRRKGEFFGRRFECFVKELIENRMFPELYGFENLGRWWHGETEIDLVGTNEKRRELLLVECKWRDDADCDRLKAELRKKAGSIGWNQGKRREKYAVFARSFKRKGEGCYDLNDIENSLNRTIPQP